MSRAAVFAVVLAVSCAPSAGTPPAAEAPPSGPAAAGPVATVPSSPTPSPSPSPSPAPVPSPVPGPFDVDRAMAVVTALAGDIGPRAAGTPGDEAARRYVVAALRTAGWSVREEVVPLPQGGTTANVVARLPGASLGRPHVVVGAHLDTVAGTPGANDNATGVGVLVALAEELADEQPVLRHPVVLVAFGAEEYQPSEPRRHHLGSQAYADLRADVVVEMLGVDMVGNGPTTCLCWLRGTDDELARRLAEVADAEGLSVRAEARGDISDHGPFAHAGVPAAFLWTFDDGVLHTPADTSDRIRAEDLDRAGRLVLAWLRSR